MLNTLKHHNLQQLQVASYNVNMWNFHPFKAYIILVKKHKKYLHNAIQEAELKGPKQLFKWQDDYKLQYKKYHKYN